MGGCAESASTVSVERLASNQTLLVSPSYSSCSSKKSPTFWGNEQKLMI